MEYLLVYVLVSYSLLHIYGRNDVVIGVTIVALIVVLFDDLA